MFVFRKIWRALLFCYFRFGIRPFALLPTFYPELLYSQGYLGTPYSRIIKRKCYILVKIIINIKQVLFPITSFS